MKFEDLKLTYGYPLQLQTATLAGQPERFSCRLIGCLPERSILLSVPKQSGRLIRLRVGQKIIVRFMVDNGIGIFAAIVESQTQEPYPILHLSYPEVVTFKGIRGATRVAVREKIEAFNISQEGISKTTGFISDMSTSGCRLELHDDIADVGDTFELRARVNIREVERDMLLTCVVRSRVEPSDNLGDEILINYGVEFVNQSDEQRLVMYAYVFNQIVSQENSIL